MMNIDDSKSWLDLLQAGDQVILSGSSIASVDRVTQTQVLVKQLRFSKKNGWEIGEKNSGNRSYIEPYTVEEADLIRLSNMQNKIRRILNGIDKEQCSHLTREQCHRLWDVLREHGLHKKEQGQ